VSLVLKDIKAAIKSIRRH